jgi:hypothetical protein
VTFLPLKINQKPTVLLSITYLFDENRAGERLVGETHDFVEACPVCGERYNTFERGLAILNHILIKTYSNLCIILNIKLWSPQD